MTSTEDYQAFLRENGLTEESMQEGLRRVEVSDWPCWRVRLGESTIPGAGKGMFAAVPINPGSEVAMIFVDGKWTVCGRYGNHSNQPNSEAWSGASGIVYLRATQRIAQGEEITANYRQVKQVMEGLV